MEPKLSFSIISTVIAFISFYLFRFLHVYLNLIVTRKNPRLIEKYPWIFTTRSHTYVFIVMLFKLGLVIALIWLEIIAVPKFIEGL